MSAEMALMDELIPLLKNTCRGARTSGLKAYEANKITVVLTTALPA